MKTGDAKPPNYRATTGATSAGPPDSTDEMGLSALAWLEGCRHMDAENETEWSIPDSSVEVRQGDLLMKRALQSGQVKELYLVITADCDISNGKFGRQLACLSVISIDTYVRTIWARKKLEKLKKNELTKLRDQVAKWHTRSLGFASSISEDAAADWVRREEPAAICEKLKVPEEERKKLVAALKVFRSGIATLEAHAARDDLMQLVAYRGEVLDGQVDQHRQAVLQDAQKVPEELPEDAFLLTSLPQVSENGAVVLLREIVGAAYGAVCYRVTDVVSEDSLLRVGRLQPTFKYAVSQAFGALYSKIGLPASYERRSKGVASNLSKITWE